MALQTPLDVPEPAEVTLEAWADMDEDEPGELVDGRLVEEEVPSALHEIVVVWLIHLLNTWARPRGGWVLSSEYKLGMKAQRRGRKPDVVMYLPGSRLPALGSSMTTKPPDVVIEVISSRPRDARRDRIEKLGEYARFGVRFYWLLDPQVRSLEVFELGEDRSYTLRLAASEGSHAVPGCEGLQLDLDALWAEVSAWTEDEEESGAGED